MMVAIVALIAGLALLVWSSWIFYLAPRIIESSSHCSILVVFVENVEILPGTYIMFQEPSKICRYKHRLYLS